MPKLEHVTGTVEYQEGGLPKALQSLNERLPELKKQIRIASMKRAKETISESASADDVIIDMVGTISSLDKAAHGLVKRLRDGYALYDPELEHSIKDHEMFANKVLERPERSKGMGGNLAQEDIDALLDLAATVQSLYAQRERIKEYLDKRMKDIAPNTTYVAGAMIGAQLIALAKSLRRLAMMPAGTVQLLGAETALFRHLRNRNARPPKHGIIFNHPLLQKAPFKRRGKVATTLADQISIAARVDFFKGEFVGDTLRKKVEEVAK
ncbi:hypothetical protein GOV11_03975 [Candidatus Woesearchaeota archaeon]|nr:hypothetical protein [Candidatus Woesearchaeota archaeon]